MSPRSTAARPLILCAGALVAAVLALPTAALAAAPGTSLVSLSSTGAKGNGASLQGVASADGRWVAFTSEATNLVQPPTPLRLNVFLRDRLRGVTQQVTVGPGGVQSDQNAQGVAMSGDGRYVVFYTNATTLAPTPGGYQAFLWDRATATTRRVSTNVAPANTYDLVNDVAISADGRTIAYTANDSQTSRADVFVADVASGAVRRVGEVTPGVGANSSVSGPALSGDGQWVGYHSDATNLVTGDDAGKWDAFVESLTTGARDRVSVRSDEQQANQNSFGPSLSRDGCLVSFYSGATNLVVGAELAGNKSFVRDRCHGDTEAASLTNTGAVVTTSGSPQISQDGCVVGFKSSTVFAGSSGSALALRDRCTGVTTRADVSSAGESANASPTPGHFGLSGARGRYVVLGSTATNLDPGDTDSITDVFLRDRSDVNAPPHAVVALSQSGSRLTVDASGSSDADGYAVSASIGFGDGTPEVGSPVAAHDYARGGSYTVTVTVTDADGATDRVYRSVTMPDPPPGAPPGDAPPPPLLPGPALTPSAAPRLTGVRLDRSRFAVVPRNGRPGGGKGATLRATLSAPATVQLAFDRRVRGRRSGGRCVAGRKKGARCFTYKSVGTLSRAASAGAVRIAITGRLSSGALRAGTYRLRVAARAADGQRSTTTTLTFTVVSTRRAA